MAGEIPAHKLIHVEKLRYLLIDGFNHTHNARKEISLSFFLTHAHSDHYQGLRSTWNSGPIYCSEITARLVVHILGIDPSFLHPLPLNTPTMLLPENVTVTLIDANHCPGAIQFLFQLPDGRKIIHTGDFRFSPLMLSCPLLANFRGAHALYLDTTYCAPKYKFPSIDESINYIADTIYNYLYADSKSSNEKDTQNNNKKYLFLISTYVIGKERILQRIAERCHTKIYVSDRKAAVMECLGLSDTLFTSHPGDSVVHVVPMGFLGETWPYFRPNFKSPTEYMLGFFGADTEIKPTTSTATATSSHSHSPSPDVDSNTHIIGFVPTGWCVNSISAHTSNAKIRKRTTTRRSIKNNPSSSMNGSPDTDNIINHPHLTTVKKISDTFHVEIRSKGECSIHLVPYSEHSDYDGLLEYVTYIKPHKVIPTVVSGGGANEKEIDKVVKHFNSMIDQTASKAKFLSAFGNRGEEERKEKVQSDENDDVVKVDGNSHGNSHGGQNGIHNTKKMKRDSDAITSNNNNNNNDTMNTTTTTTKNNDTNMNTTTGINQDDEGDDDIIITIDTNIVPSSTQEQQQQQQQQLLVNLTNNSLTPHQAQQLLISCRMNVEHAADAYFDGRWRNLIASPPLSSGAKRRRSDAGQQSILSFLKDGRESSTPLLPTTIDSNHHCHATTTTIPTTTTTTAATTTTTPITTQTTHKDSTALQLPTTTTIIQQYQHQQNQQQNTLMLPLQEYHPIHHALWQNSHKRSSAPYLHLARAFDAMESTTKRLLIGDILTNMFRSVLAVSPQDIVPAAYLAIGQVGPEYKGFDLNVGGSTVAAALSQATGVSRQKIRDKYNQLGDLGDVAATLQRNQTVLVPLAPLTMSSVFETMRAIAAMKGQGAAGKRQQSVLKMLRSCRESEVKYVVRTLVQALRVGANWRSVVGALGKAVFLHQKNIGLNENGVVNDIQEEENKEKEEKEKGSMDKRRKKRFISEKKESEKKKELDAVAAAAITAYHICPNLDILIASLLHGPAEDILHRIKLSPGIPIKPMLAKISTGVRDARAQLKGGDFRCEYKYDGMRAMIHYYFNDDASAYTCKVYSRNSEDRTMSFPDAIDHVLNACGSNGNNGGNNNNNDDDDDDDGKTRKSFIIDAEIVAVDRNTNNVDNNNDGNAIKLRSFQELSSRPRTVVDENASSVTPICVFVFDILEFNSQSLLDVCLRQRRSEYLPKALPNMKIGYCQEAQGIDIVVNDIVINGAGDDVDGSTKDGDEGVDKTIQSYLIESLSVGAEGLMLKRLDAKYEPSKRSNDWIKLKKDYCEGFNDTLDLVPIGAWFGSGRKAGWYSPFLLAVWDPASEEFQSICRCMSGFSDEFYKSATARLKESVIPGRKSYYNTLEECDVWFDAKEVWEIRGADLTLSPVHRAALGRCSQERGIGLRFPRFISVRDDKGVEDATSADMIAEMYFKQSRGGDYAKKKDVVGSGREEERERESSHDDGEDDHEQGMDDV